MNIEKVKCSTPDFAKENVAKLLTLFPECAGEQGEVDFDKLRQTLSSSVIEGNVERYEFTWPGKRAAKAAASAATTRTLRPCAAESVGRDGTPGGFDSQNLYIEGDNLEVLKLLQTSYANQVKMIYIDPPYNTGHDFVYRDRFSLTDAELRRLGGAEVVRQDLQDLQDYGDEDDKNPDNLVNPVKKEIDGIYARNDSAEARYHSNWCSMMYPRLKLARNLLRDDGVIFISLDSNELTNIHKLCDEVFGASNFITDIIAVNNPRGRQSDSFVATVHEYLICYAKDISICKVNGVPLTDEQKKDYKFSDENGRYRLLGLRQRGVASLREDRPDMFFPIYVNPETLEVALEDREGWECVVPRKSDGRDGRWMWGAAKCRVDQDRLVAQKIERRNEFDIFVKDYLERDGEIRTRKFKTLWDGKELNNQVATQEVKAILGGDYMSFPKSMAYIKSVLQLGSSDNSLILDFFSGSGTTAHAVMQLNAEDGGNRKFIMVQLPEACAEDSEAAKAGYANICEIGKERIRRAGKKILDEMSPAENAENAEEKQGELDLDGNNSATSAASAGGNKYPDIGFRVLKLDTSSLNDTSATVSETTQEFKNFDRIKSDRSPEDLLFQMLLETRIPLSEAIGKAEVGGNEVFFVGCFRQDLQDLQDYSAEGTAGTGNPVNPVNPVKKALCASAALRETLIGAPLVACLSPKSKMTTDFFIEIAKLKPGIAFFRDDAFADDSARTNLQQAFDQFSPATSIKVI